MTTGRTVTGLPVAVDPGLNPDALVVAVNAQCGASIVPIGPLGSATGAFDGRMLAAHHDDLWTLHLAGCWCRGVELVVYDGDDGTLIHAGYRYLEPDGQTTTVAMITRADYGTPGA